jgi:hypothetical protein
MATPLNTGYIPSDDGMSDILHNAGHAYAMYLDGNNKEDTNEMSLDQGQVSQLSFLFLIMRNHPKS